MSGVTVTAMPVEGLLEDALRRRLADGISSAAAYGPEFTRLWELTAASALGGKLVRPRLLVGVFQAFRDADRSAGPALDHVIELATTVELLHYGFLLHDDVLDGDVVRRGRPNLIGALSAPDASAAASPAHAQHWGRTGAVLMGDLLLTSSVMSFARAEVPASTRARLLDLLEHVILETVVGEHTDIGFSDGVIAPELPGILSMTTRKTAAYSFELPLRAAAILVDASPAAESAVSVVGRHLGLAYQLQDDLLSVFGDAACHGKDPHSDLREGKETAIIAYARMTSSWPQIGRRFGSADLTGPEAAEIRDHLRDCGAEQFVQNLVAEQLAEARALLSGADEVLPLRVREVLLALANRIEGRRS
jgi:geranylgeranyl diphosphate synthase type II